MPINIDILRSRILSHLPDAEVTITDTVGDGNHLSAVVVSKKFQGLTRLAQHQLVYRAVGQDLGTTLHALALVTKCPAQEITMTIHEQIASEVKNNRVVIYMKGTADAPLCGFSAQVINIFNHLGVNYKAINVLEDPALREGIKSFNNWPTIPQIFINGEFVGGCDIIREMFQSNELQDLLKN